MKSRKVNLNWMDIDMEDLDLVKLISHFEHSNMADGKSPKTVQWYTEMLIDYVKFIRSTGRAAILHQFHAEAVREFIIHEKGRGLSPYTVADKTRALKAF